MEVIPFVCPLCKGPLAFATDTYSCDSCGRRYPIVCGIPDFRILPDRYISIEDDRWKGARLFEDGASLGFAGMIDLYWSMTPETPQELAQKFKAHMLAAAAIGETTLQALGPASPAGCLLDLGCQTGGLLVAAARRFSAVVGLDVAFRWLVVGTARLREAGVDALLVCANAEFLPFPAGSFGTVTATDLVEHLVNPAPVFAECRRVTVPGGVCYFSTNNRYSLAPEPHVNVWGVGWLPRRLQAGYVRLIAGRTYRYISLHSALELDRWVQGAGFDGCRAEPAPLGAPGRFESLQALYNRMRRTVPVSSLLRWFGPRLQILCRK